MGAIGRESGNKPFYVYDKTEVYNKTETYSAVEVDAKDAIKLNVSAYTASDVLAKVKTVDGSGSGLDADTVDGVQGALLGVGGAGYSWVDETTNRVGNVTYTNTTGRPIQVSISLTNENKKRGFTLDSIVFVVGEGASAYYHTSTCSFIVPNGSTYSYNSTFTVWSELK